MTELEEAIHDLRTNLPGLEAVVLKLNNGFSGQGNAVIELAELDSPLPATPTVFCASDETWSTYSSKIAAEGAIVEQLARHRKLISPSVQLRVVPGGDVEIVSTHDQILGGPDDQVYLGCRFPAQPEYRKEIMEHGLSVAKVLASVGVIGSFGIDFVGLPGDGGYVLNLGEINLRMGGTTHPFLMARMVTGGRLEESTGELIASGQPKSYLASDNLKSAELPEPHSEARDRLHSSGRGSPSTVPGARERPCIFWEHCKPSARLVPSASRTPPRKPPCSTTRLCRPWMRRLSSPLRTDVRAARSDHSLTRGRSLLSCQQSSLRWSSCDHRANPRPI